MKIDLDIEEEINIEWDQGKKDIILSLIQASKGIETFRINLHMDTVFFNKLKKEINEFGEENDKYRI